MPEAGRRSRSRGGGVSAKQASPIIIIVKKKHGEHDDEHGGAWKVAYADFVTAMMALFIVLWLLSASEKVQKAVGGYFQDPTGNGPPDRHHQRGHRRNADGESQGSGEPEREAGSK